MTSIERGTPAPSAEEENPTDLEGFLPAPPSKRIDDKAATLEAEIAGIKTSFNRERFIYIFVCALLLTLAVGPHLSGAMLSILVIGVVIFLLGMGKYLDFPWIVLPLERWHDMMFNAADKRLNGGGSLGVEPPQTENGEGGQK